MYCSNNTPYCKLASVVPGADESVTALNFLSLSLHSREVKTFSFALVLATELLTSDHMLTGLKDRSQGVI